MTVIPATPASATPAVPHPEDGSETRPGRQAGGSTAAESGPESGAEDGTVIDIAAVGLEAASADLANEAVDRPRLIVLAHGDENQLPGELADQFELIRPSTLRDGLEQLQSASVAGVCFPGGSAVEASQAAQDRLGGLMLESGGLLEWVPDGYCLTDLDGRVLWSNVPFRRLVAEASGEVSAESAAEVGQPEFTDLLGEFRYLDHAVSPLDESIGTGGAASATIRTAANICLEIQSTPLCEQAGTDGGLPAIEPECADSGDGVGEAATLPSYLLIHLRDVTELVRHREAIVAIEQAGLDLGDMAPEDVLDMEVEERIDLLTDKIRHYIEALLEYETVEIRLVNERTGELEPLLAIGMTDEAAARPLVAAATGQGVTGFVAATGRSYRCEDTAQDSLYLPGAADGASSITVPLTQHGEVIGTFNVESHERNAFTPRDLRLLERFSGEVAAALNTLELLAIEQTATSTRSVEKILCGISSPLDDILTNAAFCLEQYIGHDAPVAERLRQVVEDARQIRREIQESGQAACPGTRTAMPAPDTPPEAAALRGKRVLIVDEDPSVRMAGHTLLGRYGCNVETALTAEEALMMARSFHYDAVLMDIRPAGMGGTECFRRLRETSEHLPVIIMTAYGYDPTHTIVNCRKMGLQGTLFKPFRRDQLLTEVGRAVGNVGQAADRTNAASA